MNTQKVINLSLTISLLSSPMSVLAALAGPHGGGTPVPHVATPAPHIAAPAPHMSAPAAHFSAPAPHFSAPAPHFSAPAPHFSAPAPHFSAPAAHMPASAFHPAPAAFHAPAAPHMAGVPHFAAPAHNAMSHMQTPHMEAAQHFSAPAAHMSASRAEAPRQLAMSHAGAAREQMHHEQGQYAQTPHGEGAAKYEYMAPQQRDAYMSKMNAPQQRAETLNRMNPEERKSFMAPRKAGMRAGAGVGAIAAAGGAAAMMNHNNHAESERLHEHVGITREGQRTVGALPSYANPRRPQSTGLRGLEQKGEPLRYTADVRDVPRAGDAREGRAGAIDPGGYIRHSTMGDRPITPAYARAQFASAMPNFNSFAEANYRNRIANRGAWPWQLPAYAPGWFNWGGGGNCYWWQDGGSGWGYGPNCFNGWGGCLPWWGAIANLIPWGMNSDMNWVPYQDYYNGYTYGGQTYRDNYFAPNGYCPTQYIFNVATGQFLVPGQGYVDSLPPGFTAPITVSVPESVPNYNWQGQIVGYQVQTFYYNAYWNPQNEAYGYYDYRQQFHWLTFPWLNSWAGPQ